MVTFLYLGAHSVLASLSCYGGVMATGFCGFPNIVLWLLSYSIEGLGVITLVLHTNEIG